MFVYEYRSSRNTQRASFNARAILSKQQPINIDEPKQHLKGKKHIQTQSIIDTKHTHSHPQRIHVKERAKETKIGRHA